MKHVDNREFVVTYLNSASLDEVARNLGISKTSASSKAVYLRKLGVKLPKMRRGMTDRALEVAQLNSVINKHLKQSK